MDQFRLREEVQQLRKLREHYEDQLKVVGFEICDLDDDVNALLDECVELQRVSHLHELRLPYLKSYYYGKKKEQLDHNLNMARLQAEIKKQEQELEKEAAECGALEKFITSINKRLVSAAELQRNKLLIETSMKGLQDRLNGLNIPEDLDIDGLMKKVDALKGQREAKDV